MSNLGSLAACAAGIIGAIASRRRVTGLLEETSWGACLEERFNSSRVFRDFIPCDSLRVAFVAVPQSSFGVGCDFCRSFVMDLWAFASVPNEMWDIASCALG